MEQFDVVAIQDAALGIIEFELEQSLVDAGIAIAPDGHDFVRVTIEDLANAHGVIIFRDPITRAVIEEITQMDNPIRLEFIDSFDDFLHRLDAAVSV